MTQIPNKPAADSLQERLRERVNRELPDYGLAGTVTHTRTVHAWKAGMFDALKPDLIEAADALDAKDAEIAELRRALEPFGEYARSKGFGLDNHRQELPETEGVGWVYLTIGDFRRARQALGEPK